MYPLHGSKPIRHFYQYLGVHALAIDPWNDVYESNGSIDSGIIKAYTSGGASRLLTIPFGAQALAFDGSGNLYEADAADVSEYAARSKKLLRTISKNTRDVNALVFDLAGNLYASRWTGSVEVFGPGKNRPFRTIKDGIRSPYALLIGQSGNLLVANCPSCYSRDFTGSITEYTPGSDIPIRTITDGIDTPNAMALGQNGLLFVANAPFFKQGSVTVYASGTTPLRTITAGIYAPHAVAVDLAGNVYVANCNSCYGAKTHNRITVFSPDGSRILRTINSSLSDPIAIAIGKE